jgi:phage tail-like protein
MSLPGPHTAVGHSFGLEIDGVVIKQIQEISGLKLEQTVIELDRDTADSEKLPGRFKPGEVTLTRGLTEDRSFEAWLQSSRLGRKGGAIIFYDFEGAAIKRVKLENAWPKSLEYGTLKAGDTSILTEKLVVTFEGLEIE